MQAWTPAGASQGGDAARRTLGRFPRVPLERLDSPALSRLRRSRYVAGVAVLLLAVALVGGLTYYGAQQFTRRAANGRASEEAQSFASHSSRIATGDAYGAYLQILRYADEPAVHNRATPRDERLVTMQQLLYLNTNRLSALAVVDRQGIIHATTDPAITDVRQSEAFIETRANLTPINSDIILPEDGSPGYVEFTVPLRDEYNTVWAILYGRAAPATLWTETLRASIDDSRNVIINSLGQFSAGVPPELIGLPWRGRMLENGAVRADIAGTDSICGLGPIGKDTQIDHGWHVASCFPVSLIQSEANAAAAKQSVVTLAAAALALVVGAGLMRLVFAGGAGSALAVPAPLEGASDAAPDDAPPALLTPLSDAPPPTGALEPEPEPEPSPAAAAPLSPSETVALIEAYEQRNARLKERIRESVQARLLVAATRAGEAHRIAHEDPARAEVLHASAIEEIEQVRDHELRAIGQELHPALVRLGLPAALRAMRKEFADRIDLRIDVGVDVDSVAGTDRASVDGTRRVIVYRLLRDAVDALLEAGAPECDVSLERDGSMLRLRIDAAVEEVDATVLHADEMALAACGGELRVSTGDGRVQVDATILAPPVFNDELAVEIDLEALAIVADAEAEDDEPAPIADDGAAPVRTFTLDESDDAPDDTPESDSGSDADPDVA